MNENIGLRHFERMEYYNTIIKMNIYDKFSKIIYKFNNFKFKDYYQDGISFDRFYKTVIEVLEEQEELFDTLTYFCNSNNINLKNRIFKIWHGFNIESTIKEALSYNYKVTTNDKLDYIGIDMLLEAENIAIQVKPISFTKFSFDKQLQYIKDILFSVLFSDVIEDDRKPRLVLIFYDDDNLYYSTVKDLINHDTKTNSIKIHDICEIDNIFLSDYLRDMIDNVKEP